MPSTEQNVQPQPQMLFVGVNDSKRLLEAYVKRSLSLNDGTQCLRRGAHRPGKWVTIAQRDKRERKHSSDICLHIKPSDSEVDLVKDEAFSEPETERKAQEEGENPENKSKRWKKKSTLGRNYGSSASHSSDGKPRKWFLPFDKDKRECRQPKEAFNPESEGFMDKTLPQPFLPDQLESSTEVEKPKEGKKSNKPSKWKRVLGWFSRGIRDKQEEQDDNERTEEALPPPEPLTPPLSCLPLSKGDGVVLRRTRSSRKRQTQRRISLKRCSGDMGLDKTTRRPFTLDLSTEAHKSNVESIEEVKPTSSYYEKMSEELEKIVKEVKNSPIEENRTFTDSVQPTQGNDLSRSQEEIIQRIVALIKQEGDVIDNKLKENATVSSFFNTITYGSFQQLADQYVKSEVPQQTTQPPVVAPELVKFAFTLDLTARVASLSRHTPGHILGFGNQYLRDRFIYLSESNHHISDITAEKQRTSNESLDKAAAWEKIGEKK